MKIFGNKIKVSKRPKIVGERKQENDETMYTVLKYGGITIVLLLAITIVVLLMMKDGGHYEPIRW